VQGARTLSISRPIAQHVLGGGRYTRIMHGRSDQISKEFGRAARH